MQEKHFPRTIKILMAGALALKLSGCMQPPEPVRTTATPPAANWNKPQPHSAPATQQVEQLAGSDETTGGGIGDFDACRHPEYQSRIRVKPCEGIGGSIGRRSSYQKK